MVAKKLPKSITDPQLICVPTSTNIFGQCAPKFNSYDWGFVEIPDPKNNQE